MDRATRADPRWTSDLKGGYRAEPGSQTRTKRIGSSMATDLSLRAGTDSGGAAGTVVDSGSAFAGAPATVPPNSSLTRLAAGAGTTSLRGFVGAKSSSDSGGGLPS